MPTPNDDSMGRHRVDRMPPRHWDEYSDRAGVVYTVVYIDDQKVVLQMRKECTERLNPEDEDNEVHEVTIPLGDVPTLLRLTHAMCYFTCQGALDRPGQTGPHD